MGGGGILKGRLYGREDSDINKKANDSWIGKPLSAIRFNFMLKNIPRGEDGEGKKEGEKCAQ